MMNQKSSHNKWTNLDTSGVSKAIGKQSKTLDCNFTCGSKHINVPHQSPHAASQIFAHEKNQKQ